MAKPLAGLLVRLGRRRTQQEGSPGEGPVVDADAMPLESAQSEPSLALMPAAIFRQVLFDAAELTPAWARPRPAPVPDLGSSAGATVDNTVVPTIAPIEESASPQRTRRPKPEGSSGTSRPRTRRVAKPDHSGTDG